MGEIAASLFVYVGGACLLLAVILRRRKLVLAGAACLLLGFGMPPLGEEFTEVHEIDVAAPPERAYRATLETTPDEILFYQTLTAIRRLFGGGGGTNILQAAGGRPIWESAEKGGFYRVSETPNREIVEGARLTPAIQVTLNFTFTPSAEGTQVRTETRVRAANARAKWLFAAYWRTIYPGSSLIRHMWLRAIRLRATS